MIKNFIKMQGKELNVPVWSAGHQKYKVLSVHEMTNHIDYWKGQIVTKFIPSVFSVPRNIEVEISKYHTQMEWDVQITHTDEQGKSRTTRTVMVSPHHMKTPETFGKLIADIIDKQDINYFK